MDYQRLLLDHLDLINQIVRTVGRRRHLSPAEREELASFVHLRLVDDNYAILRKFQGRSTLWTYLAAVIERMSLDFCSERWGRWRPSAMAERLGPVAVVLERLVNRDAHPVEEAIDIVRNNHDVGLTEAQLRRLWQQLPLRLRTTEVGEDAAHLLTSNETAEAAIEDADRRRDIDRLQRALESAFAQISAQDRVLIALRFDEDLSMIAIARLMGSSVPTLHRRLDKSVRQLRLALTHAGFDPREVASSSVIRRLGYRRCCAPKLRSFWGLSVYPSEMVNPPLHGCLQPEVLAAYVDRGLSLTERARVDLHLASCPQCIALLAGVARTVVEVSAHVPDAVVAAEATPLVTRRSLAGAVAAAAAVIAVLAGPSLVGPWLQRDAGLVNLVGDVGEHRSVLGRLTGGLPHAPLGAPSAGGQDGRTAGTDRVLLTAGKIRESFGERETPSQLHSLGVSQLLAGHYDDAAQLLLAASREQPANGRYLNDVATVQLERARRGLRPDDLPRALASADRARRLDPSLNEAWFNRALAVSSLSLAAEARSAWTEYLKRDGTSAWAAEARSRLGELSKPTPASAWVAVDGRLQQSIDAATAEEAVRTQTTEARNLIDSTLIPAWANAVLSGQPSQTALEPVRVMGEAMLRVAGDALYVDTVNAIDRAGALGGARLAALALAHRDYAAAATIYGDDRYALAEPGLRSAATALAAADTPYAIRARLDLASIAYVSGRYAEVASKVPADLATSREHRYGYNAGRASWILGLTAFLQGRHSDALARYEDTLAEFDAIHDAEQVAAAHNLLAALFHYLGDDRQAWEHMTPALTGLGLTRSFKLRHGLLINAALTVRSINQETALAIQDEVIRNAQAWGREAAISEAFAQRASINWSLNRHDAAQRDLQEARREMAASPDRPFNARLETTILATESELLRGTNPAGAVKAAERAIALAASRRDRMRVAQLQWRVAQANIVWGHHADAELALRRGIAAFEEERRGLSDEGRISSRDELWGLFETSVQLAIKNKDFDRAFAMAERAHGRTLAEARRMAEPRSLRAVQASLRSDEAIIALNQFSDELAIWVISSGRTNVITRPLTRRDAEELIARQQDEIRGGAAVATAGGLLFDEILRPVAARLRGIKRLIVVPDTTYENTAFSALWNTTSRRFIIEEATVRVAPSATAYAVAVDRDRAMSGSLIDALAVGAADNAGARAQAVAAMYTQSALLTGPAATRARIFDGAQSIVHLAAPVSNSPGNPLLSRLILADDPGVPHSGVISGSEIAARSLPNTRLVVIDEVETSRSDWGEGTLSMARAFLAAGVPAALGTLPGADATATRDLMIGFHREMSKGISAEQALQTVQRNAVQKNGRRLGAWCALVLYGSDR